LLAPLHVIWMHTSREIRRQHRSARSDQDPDRVARRRRSCLATLRRSSEHSEETVVVRRCHVVSFVPHRAL
jgi:hypothetical protein